MTNYQIENQNIHFAAKRWISSINLHLGYRGQKKLISIMIESLYEIANANYTDLDLPPSKQNALSTLKEELEKLLSQKINYQYQIGSYQDLSVHHTIEAFYVVSRFFFAKYNKLFDGALADYYSQISNRITTNKVSMDFIKDMINIRDNVGQTATPVGLRSFLIYYSISFIEYNGRNTAIKNLLMTAAEFINVATKSLTYENQKRLIKLMQPSIPEQIAIDAKIEFKDVNSLSGVALIEQFKKISECFFQIFISTFKSNILYEFLDETTKTNPYLYAFVEDIIADGVINDKIIQKTFTQKVIAINENNLTAAQINKLQKLVDAIIKGADAEYLQQVLQETSINTVDLNKYKLIICFYQNLHMYLQLILQSNYLKEKAKIFIESYLTSLDTENIKDMMFTVRNKNGIVSININIKFILEYAIGGYELSPYIIDVLLRQHMIEEFVKQLLDCKPTEEYLNSILEQMHDYFAYSYCVTQEYVAKSGYDLLKSFSSGIKDYFLWHIRDYPELKFFAVNALENYYKNNPNNKDVIRYNMIKDLLSAGEDIANEENAQKLSSVHKEFIDIIEEQVLAQEAIEELVKGPDFAFMKRFISTTSDTMTLRSIDNFVRRIIDNLCVWIDTKEDKSRLLTFLEKQEIRSNDIYDKKAILKKLINDSDKSDDELYEKILDYNESIGDMMILNIIHQEKSTADRMSLATELMTFVFSSLYVDRYNYYYKNLNSYQMKNYISYIVKYVNKLNDANSLDISLKNFIKSAQIFYNTLVGDDKGEFTKEIDSFIATHFTNNKLLIDDNLYNFLKLHDFNIGAIQEKYTDSQSSGFKLLESLKKQAYWPGLLEIIEDAKGDPGASIESKILKKSEFYIINDITSSGTLSDLDQLLIDNDINFRQHHIKEWTYKTFFSSPEDLTDYDMCFVIKTVKGGINKFHDSRHTHNREQLLKEFYAYDVHKGHYGHQFIAMMADSQELKDFAMENLLDILASPDISQSTGAIEWYNKTQIMTNILSGSVWDSFCIQDNSNLRDISDDHKKEFIKDFMSYLVINKQLPDNYINFISQYIDNNKIAKDSIHEYVSENALPGFRGHDDICHLKHQHIDLLASNQLLQSFTKDIFERELCKWHKFDLQLSQQNALDKMPASDSCEHFMYYHVGHLEVSQLGVPVGHSGFNSKDINYKGYDYHSSYNNNWM